MITARVHGTSAERVDDVGVAGLHRLLAVRDRLDDADALIVVAGMEGALPSVVGGLTGVPLVAVPTSIGYGTGAGGLAALLAMLNSCAPGIAVVNVDNGYGAGVHAARIARRARPRDDADGRGLMGEVWVDASQRRQRRHAARRAARPRRPGRGDGRRGARRRAGRDHLRPRGAARFRGGPRARARGRGPTSRTAPGPTSASCWTAPTSTTPVRDDGPRRVRPAGRGRGPGARHQRGRRALPRGRRARRDR